MPRQGICCTLIPKHTRCLPSRPLEEIMEPDVSHERPDWRNERLGTRVRVALWLLSEVGEGNSFTKDQLRQAFPKAEQVDRRLRDLRESGWVIHTNRTHSRLGASEMLFAEAGEPIWEPGRTIWSTRRALTPHIRDKVFERDGYSCVNCGLSVVEGPLEASIKTVLEIAHVTPLAAGGTSGLENLITLCANCHRLFDHGTVQHPDAEEVWDIVQELSEQDQARLLAWIAMDRKPPTQAEKAWSLYRRLRPEQRTSVAHRLGQAVLDRTDADGSE
ncbi:HNH endonuclease [Microbispora rosea]|uniref:HNH endonuclease n=1 Tax=Microbispora rosea TaxID=58117 RepID=UPI0036A18980